MADSNEYEKIKMKLLFDFEDPDLFTSIVDTLMTKAKEDGIDVKYQHVHGIVWNTIKLLKEKGIVCDAIAAA